MDKMIVEGDKVGYKQVTDKQLQRVLRAMGIRSCR